MKHIRTIMLFSVFAGFGFPAANAQTSIGVSPSSRKVHVAFAAEVGGKPFACGRQYEGIGLGRSTVKASDLRFFVSSVELVTAAGQAVPVQLDQDGLWQHKNLALLDFEDGTGSCSNGNAGLHEEVEGTVPAGDYVGLRFTLGVPFELDHLDPSTAPSPLNTTAMFWSWQTGYKFLRAEVITVPAPGVVPVALQMPSSGAMSKSRSHGFPMHLGSTGCTSTTVTSAPGVECAHPNRPVITFSAFNVDRDTVVFDLAKLLQGVDVAGGGCMSFAGSDACVPTMQALGLPFRDAPATEQVVFTRRVQQ